MQWLEASGGGRGLICQKFATFAAFSELFQSYFRAISRLLRAVLEVLRKGFESFPPWLPKISSTAPLGLTPASYAL